MSIHTIISLATTFACIGILVVLPVFLVSYFVIYRKLLKGKRRLTFGQVLWTCIFLCYGFIVLSATIFMRFPSWWTGEFYPLFYSYREAWITGSAASWRNIFLNYLMFVPIGFLLPIGMRHFEKCGWTVLFAFCFSLTIEVIQYVSKRGMFELDDLLGNTLGALIGFGLYRLALHTFSGLKRRQQKRQFTIVS